MTLATEHKCVLESVSDLAAEGFEPVVLPVRPDGLADLEALRAALDDRTLLLSVMAVNNETGVVQDLAAERSGLPLPWARGTRPVYVRIQPWQMTGRRLVDD